MIDLAFTCNYFEYCFFATFYFITPFVAPEYVFIIIRMNVRAARYEWKVAAIRFARKTGSYDRNRSSPLQRVDFTRNFQVTVEKFDVSVRIDLQDNSSN